jgi:hypothetical protein
MNPQLNSPIDRQLNFAKQMATDFDAWLLRNIVWSVIETDEQLRHLCDSRRAAREAATLREQQQGEDVEYIGKVEAIEMTLDQVTQKRALELVAVACAECLANAEEWASNRAFDDEHVEEAQAEARQWLREHPKDAARVGVLGILESA